MSSENTASGPDVPSVTNEEIATNAWMIYEMIRNTGPYKHGRRRQYDGQPGIEWTGSVNNIINSLWPAITDRFLTTKEDAEEIKLKLNRYLRYSRNLVCLRNGGVHGSSTWWVADNWSALTVTQVKNLVNDDHVTVISDPTADQVVTRSSGPEVTSSDVFDVQQGGTTSHSPGAISQPLNEPSTEEAMRTDEAEDEAAGDDTDEPGEFPCRYEKCTRMFNWATGRASHERSHGIRVNSDGTVVAINGPVSSENHTTASVKSAVARAASALTEPITVTDLINHVKDLNPTMTRKIIGSAVAGLIEKPWNGSQLVKTVQVVEGTANQAHTRRYRLERVKPTPATVTVHPAPTTPTISVAQVIASKINQRDEKVAMTGDQSVTEHAANLRSLLVSMRRWEQLEAENTRLQEGLKASSAKNHDLVDRLRAVTKERDELRAKLDTLRSVFGTALAE